jgi:hypothetical protein
MAQFKTLFLPLSQQIAVIIIQQNQIDGVHVRLLSSQFA